MNLILKSSQIHLKDSESSENTHFLDIDFDWGVTSAGENLAKAQASMEARQKAAEESLKAAQAQNKTIR